MWQQLEQEIGNGKQEAHLGFMQHQVGDSTGRLVLRRFTHLVGKWMLAVSRSSARSEGWSSSFLPA